MKGIVDIFEERGKYILARSTATKTAGCDEARELQILMGQRQFLTEQPRLQLLLKRREDLGVFPKPGWPIMHAKNRRGEWVKRPLCLADYLLRIALRRVGVTVTTSHALEAQAQHWGSMRVLGYRRVAVESEAIKCYSRDRLTKSVQELDKMLKEIISRAVDPDGDELYESSQIAELDSEAPTQKWSHLKADGEISPPQEITKEESVSRESDKERSGATASSQVDSEDERAKTLRGIVQGASALDIVPC